MSHHLSLGFNEARDPTVSSHGCLPLPTPLHVPPPLFPKSSLCPTSPPSQSPTILSNSPPPTTHSPSHPRLSPLPFFLPRPFTALLTPKPSHASLPTHHLPLPPIALHPRASRGHRLLRPSGLHGSLPAPPTHPPQPLQAWAGHQGEGSLRLVQKN